MCYAEGMGGLRVLATVVLVACASPQVGEGLDGEAPDGAADDALLPTNDSRPPDFDPDAACATASAKADPKPLPVDIIWMVDNSVSMAPAVSEVQAGINAFASLVGMKALDYTVVMLSLRSKTSPITVGGATRFPVCVPQPLAGDANCGNGARFFHSSMDIKSTQPLEQFLGTLAQTTGFQQGDLRGGEPWKMALRPKATKTIVVVTDDNSRFLANQFESFAGGKNPFNSTQLPPGILDPYWNGMFQGYVFGGVYGWGNANDPNIKCTYANNTQPPASGLTYTDLVMKTKGPRAKICDGANAWTVFFNAVAQAVVDNAKIACELAIPAPGLGQTLDPSKINVVIDDNGKLTTLTKTVGGANGCGTNLGWYYDDDLAPTKVILCPAACALAQTLVGPNKQAGVSVFFGCATLVK